MNPALFRHEKARALMPDYTPAWKGLHRVLIKALWESASRRDVLPACLSTSAHSTLTPAFCFGLLPFVLLLAALHFAFAHLFTRSAPHHQSALASTTSPKKVLPSPLIISCSCPTHTPTIAITLPLSPWMHLSPSDITLLIHVYSAYCLFPPNKK